MRWHFPMFDSGKQHVCQKQISIYGCSSSDLGGYTAKSVLVFCQRQRPGPSKDMLENQMTQVGTLMWHWQPPETFWSYPSYQFFQLFPVTLCHIFTMRLAARFAKRSVSCWHQRPLSTNRRFGEGEGQVLNSRKGLKHKATKGSVGISGLWLFVVLDHVGFQDFAGKLQRAASLAITSVEATWVLVVFMSFFCWWDSNDWSTCSCLGYFAGWFFVTWHLLFGRFYFPQRSQR